MIDRFLAGVLLILLGPLMLGIGLLIWMVDGGPVLFRQVRVGKGGKPFVLLKFRTMKTGEAGSPVTASGDPRIFPVGRWLRKFRLDELPQLINILRGEMRFVGFRAEIPEYVRWFPEEYRILLEQPPGLTDPVTLQWLDEAEEIQRILNQGIARSPHEAYLRGVLPRKVCQYLGKFREIQGWKRWKWVLYTVYHLWIR